jgi:hypothetical protein
MHSSDTAHNKLVQLPFVPLPTRKPVAEQPLNSQNRHPSPQAPLFVWQRDGDKVTKRRGKSTAKPVEAEAI